MNGRTDRTPEKEDRFLAALAATGHVNHSAEAAGVARRTLYDWRAADEEFARRWEEAVVQSVERLEREADRRAAEGTLKPVFHQGVECGQIREYSDTLLIFRLKALAPDKYRERSMHEHVGAGGKDLIPQTEIDTQKLALALVNVLQAGKKEGGE